MRTRYFAQVHLLSPPWRCSCSPTISPVRPHSRSPSWDKLDGSLPCTHASSGGLTSAYRPVACSHLSDSGRGPFQPPHPGRRAVLPSCAPPPRPAWLHTDLSHHPAFLPCLRPSLCPSFPVS